MRRRTADLHCHMLGGTVAIADNGIKVIDADHIKVRIVLEEVSLNSDHLSQPFFIQQVSGKQYIALLAPLMDLLVVSLTIKIGERIVEIIAHASAVRVDVEEEVRQARA